MSRVQRRTLMRCVFFLGCLGHRVELREPGKYKAHDNVIPWRKKVHFVTFPTKKQLHPMGHTSKVLLDKSTFGAYYLIGVIGEGFAGGSVGICACCEGNCSGVVLPGSGSDGGLIDS